MDIPSEVLASGPVSQGLNPCMTPVALDARSTGETQVKLHPKLRLFSYTCQGILPGLETFV